MGLPQLFAFLHRHGQGGRRPDTLGHMGIVFVGDIGRASSQAWERRLLPCKAWALDYLRAAERAPTKDHDLWGKLLRVTVQSADAEQQGFPV